MDNTSPRCVEDECLPPRCRPSEAQIASVASPRCTRRRENSGSCNRQSEGTRGLLVALRPRLPSAPTRRSQIRALQVPTRRGRDGCGCCGCYGHSGHSGCCGRCGCSDRCGCCGLRARLGCSGRCDRSGHSCRLDLGHFWRSRLCRERRHLGLRVGDGHGVHACFRPSVVLDLGPLCWNRNHLLRKARRFWTCRLVRHPCPGDGCRPWACPGLDRLWISWRGARASWTHSLWRHSWPCFCSHSAVPLARPKCCTRGLAF